MNALLLKLFDNRISIFLLFVLVIITFNFWPNWSGTASARVVDEQTRFLHNNGFHHEIDDKIVVVEVDEKSIDKHGRWPWPRSILAELFLKLSLSSVVVADIIFSEEDRTDPKQDELLADALMEADNAILGFFLRPSNSGAISENAYYYIEQCALQRVESKSDYNHLPSVKSAEINIPLLAEAATSCALFSTTADEDGIYRSYPLLYGFQNLVIPTLATQAFQYDTNQELSVTLNQQGIEKLTGKNLTIENQNNFLINFPRKINTVSATDILNGKISQEYFTDKIVLIGLTEIGIYDIRPTALDEYRPGVHIHAAALSNMMQNNWYVNNPQLSMLITLLSIVVLLLVNMKVQKNGVRWAIYFSGIALIIAICTVHMYTQLEVIDLFSVLVFTVSCILIIEALNRLTVDSQYASVKSAFSSYVVPEIVDTIVNKDIAVKLDGELKEVNVMFADIQGFTQMSERLEPQQIITMLNTVFEPATSHVINNKGMLDKYIGDEIMAIFNAPIEIDDYHNKSVNAAIAIQQSLSDINKTLAAQNLPSVRWSIGLNHGPVIVGNLGSSLRVSYTAVGNTVNVAARITALSKSYGQHLLITEEIYQNLSEQLQSQFHFVDKVVVKGKTSFTTLFGLENVNNQTNPVVQDQYLAAYNNYENGEFELALEKFSVLVNHYNHGASICLLARTRNLLKVQPKDWDGIFRFDHK